MNEDAPGTATTPEQAAYEGYWLAVEGHKGPVAWEKLRPETAAWWTAAAQAAIAAQQPQPAPGVTEAQLAEALSGFNVDISDHGFTAAGVVDRPREAAKALLARLSRGQRR